MILTTLCGLGNLEYGLGNSKVFSRFPLLILLIICFSYIFPSSRLDFTLTMDPRNWIQNACRTMSKFELGSVVWNLNYGNVSKFHRFSATLRFIQSKFKSLVKFSFVYASYFIYVFLCFSLGLFYVNFGNSTRCF